MGWMAGITYLAKVRIFSSPLHPDWYWGPSSLLSNGYLGIFFPGAKQLGVKLTTHFHLVPRSRMMELYLRSPIFLHGIVLNSLSTGTTSPFFTFNGFK
jgi:hypothetical protein